MSTCIIDIFEIEIEQINEILNKYFQDDLEHLIIINIKIKKCQEIKYLNLPISLKSLMFCSVHVVEPLDSNTKHIYDIEHLIKVPFACTLNVVGKKYFDNCIRYTFTHKYKTAINNSFYYSNDGMSYMQIKNDCKTKHHYFFVY